ncbi:MAG: 1-acyl-sn-glycerol-3-phosphate acyltransferase [Clostridia bacterium]|nr:1-acyl-sn-glycerol-3-phosphate acyltransferase [Clostridia bacterium]
MNKGFYRFARALARPVIYLLYWYKFEGRENLEYDGKMLIYANHLSFMDVVFIGLADRHFLSFMAKKELFRNKLFGKILEWLGAFPVDRDAGGLAAMNKACNILNDGHPLMIFPEGTRNLKDEEIGEFHPGVTMMAIRTDSPVLPILITHRPKKFRRNIVKIGKPIPIKDLMEEGVSRTQNNRIVTAKLKDILNGMKEQE